MLRGEISSFFRHSVDTPDLRKKSEALRKKRARSKRRAKVLKDNDEDVIKI